MQIESGTGTPPPRRKQRVLIKYPERRDELGRLARQEIAYIRVPREDGETSADMRRKQVAWHNAAAHLGHVISTYTDETGALVIVKKPERADLPRKAMSRPRTEL